MNDDVLLLNAVEQLLAGCCSPHVIREIESGGDAIALWQQIEDSGFCDALVAESNDGAGLGWNSVLQMFETCGKYALPVPMAQTMVARALITQAGHVVPSGPIALATAPAAPGAAIQVSYGMVAKWVLLERDGSLRLIDASQATRDVVDAGSVDAWMHWPSGTTDGQTMHALPNFDLRSIEAALLAAQISGALQHVFTLSLGYANERSQFGRSIGKFQAIQHQLSVMAENTAAARMAGRMLLSGAAEFPGPLSCAVAKARCSEAVTIVAAGAHAIHGAIGITEEYDLQLYTRRLYAWRSAAGSETYWNARIGRALLDSPHATVPDFVRLELTH